MDKRLPISFFLLLAFTMLQAHNYIPHTHKANPVVPHSHEHGENHDHDDKGDHQAPFTDLTHNSDFGKAISKPYFEKQVIAKYGFSTGLFVHPLYMQYCFISLPRPHPPDFTSSLHLIFISHSVPLRAPPIA